MSWYVWPIVFLNTGLGVSLVLHSRTKRLFWVPLGLQLLLVIWGYAETVASGSSLSWRLMTQDTSVFILVALGGGGIVLALLGRSALCLLDRRRSSGERVGVAGPE